MNLLRLRRRRLPAWCAIGALLATLLLPGAAQWLQPRGADGGWAEVCSAAGARWTRLQSAGDDDGGSDPAPHGAPAADHCVACLIAAVAAPAPARGSLRPVPAASRPVRADAGAGVVAAVAAAAPPQARGPPLPANDDTSA